MAVYLIYPHPPAVLHMNMPSSGYTGGGGGGGYTEFANNTILFTQMLPHVHESEGQG